MNPRGARWFTWASMTVLVALTINAALDSPWSLVVHVPVLAFAFAVLSMAEGQ